MRTYVLDAGALLALLQLAPAASRVSDIIKEAVRGHCRILMSSVNYGEAYGLLLQGPQRSRAAQIMNAVTRLPIELHDVTPQRSLRAAELKTTYRLYYADSFAAALAMENKARLVSNDPDFRKLGHNFPVLWLKN